LFFFCFFFARRIASSFREIVLRDRDPRLAIEIEGRRQGLLKSVRQETLKREFCSANFPGFGSGMSCRHVSDALFEGDG
jgi:hypothetical protein